MRVKFTLYWNKRNDRMNWFLSPVIIRTLLSTYFMTGVVAFLIGRRCGSAPRWFSTPTHCLPRRVAPGNVCQLGVSWQTRWRTQSNKQFFVTLQTFWQTWPLFDSFTWVYLSYSFIGYYDVHKLINLGAFQTGLII